MKMFFMYLDAGSGSYLVQIIIGAILAGTVYFKTIWHKIKSVFYKPKMEEEDEEVEIEDTTNTNQH